MPFTPAHIVAAVPLASALGRHGVVSALAIGSMAPDLAYFLPFDVARLESHSLPALVWFCLPVGLATWAFFHVFAAPLLHDVTPRVVRERLPGAWARGEWPRVPIASVALCIVLGAMTHLVWDSFTHYGTPLTRAVPMLAMPMGEIGGVTIRPVRIAQHISTAFGLALLGVWGWRWLGRPPVEAASHPPPSHLVRLALVALVTVPALWLGLADAMPHVASTSDPARQLVRLVQGLVFVGGSAFVASLTFVAASWRLLRGTPLIPTSRDDRIPSS